MTDEIRTTCAYCGVGCGILAKADGQGGVTLRGDPDHPANQGRLCSKGFALGETLSLDDRLLAPRINGIESDWDSALALVAERFSQTIATHGPDSVAFYVSGQLLTEDYYVANKLMKGFIGSANIDTNSRLCMASTVAGHKRAFGADTVPGTYEDLELADLVVLTGSNLAWCHPVLYQRIAAAKEARPDMRVVVIDPRRTATCDLADLHLALEPGSDVALFNRLLAAIHAGGAVNREYLRHVSGFDDSLRVALAEDGAATGLPPDQIDEFCQLWLGTEKVVTVFSQGVNQSSSGTDKVNAIINCHLATGRIGKPGMGPFSVTGQPNAMGGREVGGLANSLACHLDLENPDHRERLRDFWNAPAIPAQAGLKAVDLFDRVRSGHIKALWIVCTNPAATMPDANIVQEAIAGCDFTVVSDLTARTDTARLADVLLPATGWGEKDGTVTNSDRTISRQRAIMRAPGQARHDWDIMAEVGRRMGWTEAFDYSSPAQIFDEHARLSAIAAAEGRDFDISGLTGLGRDGYDALPPTRWPITAQGQQARFFADGGFFTDNGQARMIPVSARPPVAQTDAAFPFRLNTGRIRDQWHTMTRTGKSPRLNQHLGEPFLEIHPDDAAQLGIPPAGLVEVSSPAGRCILRALVTDRVRCGHVFAPMHWSGQSAPTGRIDALVSSIVDPVSGQPESKAAAVAIAPHDTAWFGFAISTTEFRPDCTYWARCCVAKGWRSELAGTREAQDWETYARALFSLPDARCQSISDPATGTARLAFLDGDTLLAALFVSRNPVSLSRDHIAAQLGSTGTAPLSGRPGRDASDPGPVVCACLNVGMNTIREAIASGQACSVARVGDCTGAGTNCGSCRPEIAVLLGQVRQMEAAE
ncbi:nitrate reductase [Paracoccus seriniphilus]|uniref:Assimilatory nitrate reductase (NADH) alpha subunit apoprotein n=1 Tax=Paracoccus seriniphilus TaxID=184748 RepID=A0A239PRX9_9RHOB|nr:nitrate reductase [Paracoccus seriniphilus]WCR12773.1 molybdopterin-dependent oxidoreductase [Paracoccus seriniphilus]SNT72813.1 assimilatory nitrate reductase (NADH) alpha subunit apoprotein [Paracoccus seriniphilus]